MPELQLPDIMFEVTTPGSGPNIYVPGRQDHGRAIIESQALTEAATRAEAGHLLSNLNGGGYLTVRPVDVLTMNSFAITCAGVEFAGGFHPLNGLRRDLLDLLAGKRGIHLSSTEVGETLWPKIENPMKRLDRLARRTRTFIDGIGATEVAQITGTSNKGFCLYPPPPSDIGLSSWVIHSTQ